MKRSSKTLWIVLALLFSIVLGGLGYYHFIYTKSPAYSLQLVGQAIQKKDYPQFAAHVDIPSVVDHLVDEAFSQDPQIKNNPFAMMLAPSIKKYVSTVLSQSIQESFREAKKEQQQYSDAPQAQPASTESPSDDIQNMVKNLRVESMTTSYSDADPGIAYVAVQAKDVTNGKLVHFNIEMRRLPDRTWTVIAVTGLLDQMPSLLPSKTH